MNSHLYMSDEHISSRSIIHNNYCPDVNVLFYRWLIIGKYERYSFSRLRRI